MSLLITFHLHLFIYLYTSRRVEKNHTVWDCQHEPRTHQYRQSHCSKSNFHTIGYFVFQVYILDMFCRVILQRTFTERWRGERLWKVSSYMNPILMSEWITNVSLSQLCWPTASLSYEWFPRCSFKTILTSWNNLVILTPSVPSLIWSGSTQISRGFDFRWALLGFNGSYIWVLYMALSGLKRLTIMGSIKWNHVSTYMPHVKSLTFPVYPSFLHISWSFSSHQ